MPHKTLRKALNAQKLPCKACIAYLQGSDGITKTTMWKKFATADRNLSNPRTFLIPTSTFRRPPLDLEHDIYGNKSQETADAHRAGCPATEAVPPKLYGGTERVVHWLTEELVALGHDVTLFASGDSLTSARLDATWPRALRLDGAVRDPNALHMVMLERVRRKCDDGEFDFLHFHLDYYPFSLFSRQPTPFLTTLHGRLDLPELQPVFNEFSSVPLISISNAQRRPAPQARWLRTVYHGLPEKLLTPRPGQPSYLAVLGRIAPEKGVDRAIRIAIRCGIPLKIAAKVDRADQDYYDECIRPMMDHPLVEFIGEISDRRSRTSSAAPSGCWCRLPGLNLSVWL